MAEVAGVELSQQRREFVAGRARAAIVQRAPYSNIMS